MRCIKFEVYINNTGSDIDLINDAEALSKFTRFALMPDYYFIIPKVKDGVTLPSVISINSWELNALRNNLEQYFDDYRCIRGAYAPVTDCLNPLYTLGNASNVNGVIPNGNVILYEPNNNYAYCLYTSTVCIDLTARARKSTDNIFVYGRGTSSTKGYKFGLIYEGLDNKIYLYSGEQTKDNNNLTSAGALSYSSYLLEIPSVEFPYDTTIKERSGIGIEFDVYAKTEDGDYIKTEQKGVFNIPCLDKYQENKISNFKFSLDNWNKYVGKKFYNRLPIGVNKYEPNNAYWQCVIDEYLRNCKLVHKSGNYIEVVNNKNSDGTEGFTKFVFKDKNDIPVYEYIMGGSGSPTYYTSPGLWCSKYYTECSPSIETFNTFSLNTNPDIKFIAYSSRSAIRAINTYENIDNVGNNKISLWFNAVMGYKEGGGDNPYNPSLPEKVESDVIDNTLASGFMKYGDTNLLTIFVPSEAQLQQFAGAMYGDSFLNWLKNNVYASGVLHIQDIVLNLMVLPLKINKVGTKRLMAGWIEAGIDLDYTDNNYAYLDCGELKIDPLWNNALDYSTQIQIYLPFVGTQTLNTDEVMGKTLKVIYRIDLVSGACLCQILVDGSCLYQFSGDCSYSLPITSVSYNDMLMKVAGTAVSIGLGISGANEGLTLAKESADLQAELSSITTFGGKAKKGFGARKKEILSRLEEIPMESEAAGNTAIENLNKVAGNISSLNFGGASRTGSVSGSVGNLSINRPYLILKRPNLSTPDNFSKYNGYKCNKFLKLGNLKGYTEVSAIHLEGIPCSANELELINKYLHSGVIF